MFSQMDKHFPYYLTAVFLTVITIMYFHFKDK
jgi:hypothetical protein